MTTIKQGSTIYTEYIFRRDGVYVDPDSFEAEIFIYDSATEGYIVQDPITEVINITRLSLGVYSGDWLTSIEGRFKIRVAGIFAGAEPIVYEKYFLIGDFPVLKDLDASYLVTILGELTPLYVNPEYVLEYYTGSDLVEITEIIHRKSLELENKVGEANLDVTAIQHDFVFAATMCELSRIYGLSNGGIGGFTSAASFKLGDLEVDKGSTGGRLTSGNYDDGNAGSWCELAASLKSQLSTSSGNFRPVVPGAAFCNTVLNRDLRSEDF